MAEGSGEGAVRRVVRRGFSGECMKLDDGAGLFYRHWYPAGEPARTVILLHRGHEHSGRMAELAEQFVDDGAEVFAWDARGHGLSGGDAGRVPSFGRLVRDLDAFVRHVRDMHRVPMERMVVMGNSVGSVIAATWVHDHAPPIRALVLGTPAFRVKLYVPLALFFLRLLAWVMPRANVRSYVKPGLLTHDVEQAARYANDPLITPRIAVPVLVGMYDAARRVVADAAAIRVPVLVLSSGDDWVVHRGPQEAFFRALSSPRKRMQVYPGLFHDLFHEKDRHLPIQEARAFIREMTSSPAAEPEASTPGSDRVLAALSTPLPPWSPRRWAWAAYRLFLSTVGRLSRGIRVGFSRGFDSGASLDHVYENRARGLTPLGRLVDRVYLEAPGWRGIRTRRMHVERALEECVEMRAAELGRVPRLMDVACGHGRYLVGRAAQGGMRLLLRDRDPRNLEAAATLAAQSGVAGVEVQEADAFDVEGYRSAGRVDVAVVSGLFELFPDNDAVTRALQGIRSTMEPGARLVFTNQPWHPQLEMIARVLPNRDGKPWVMRCRSQAEMDALVERAGFRKSRQFNDDDGIFTVSVARAA